MDLGLSGKIAIVTGGGSNIGRGISLTFAKEGASVVIAELDTDQGNKVAREITASGGKAEVIGTDVTNNDSVQNMVKTVVDKYGRVDILVNNVGWDNPMPWIDQERAEWEKIMNINFWGMLNCTRAVADTMISQKYGKIVSIGSDAGRVGEFREAVYSGAKAGVISMSKALAKELGKFNININVVCPGLTLHENPDDIGKYSMHVDHIPGRPDWTPEKKEQVAKSFYPLRRLGKPQDLANAVVFMASDNASFITGQTLSVSGGYSMM